jgi:hypothetical protein
LQQILLFSDYGFPNNPPEGPAVHLIVKLPEPRIPQMDRKDRIKRSLFRAAIIE